MAKLTKEQLAQLMHSSTPPLGGGVIDAALQAPSYLDEEETLGTQPLYAQYPMPSASMPTQGFHPTAEYPHAASIIEETASFQTPPISDIFSADSLPHEPHETLSNHTVAVHTEYGLAEDSPQSPRALPLADTLQEDLQVLRESAYQEASQQGYQDGYEAGLKQGYEEAERRLEEQLLTLHDGIESILSAKEKAFESVKDELLPLVYQLVEKIIKTEATCDPELVLHLLKDSLRQSDRNAKQLIVHVHPENIVVVEQWLAEHPNPFRLEGKISVEENLNVELGSCMIETKNGMLDARFSTQLESLKSLLGLNQTVVGAPIQASDNPS